MIRHMKVKSDISQYAVKGGKGYKEGKATSIEGIQVVDPQTIKITTEKVNSQAIFVFRRSQYYQKLIMEKIISKIQA